MPRHNVTVIFRNPNVTTASLVYRKRLKQTGPIDGFPTEVESHPMTQDPKNPQKFTARGIPKPAVPNTHKLLIRIIGMRAGVRVAVIDAPARQYPLAKKDRKEKK